METDKELLEKIEQLTKENETLRKNSDIIKLGEDEAFALRDNGGDIRAFKQRVRLSSNNGTLVQPVNGGPYVVSAQGFEVLAEAAGACAIFPKEVLVGNEWHPNPYAERDPNNRRILAVHARAIAFRFSSKGLPQVSDWTTIFDTPSYRLIDLLAKAKKYPQAFKLLPQDMTPENGKNSTWAQYPFDESTKLWVNTAHEEALTWFSQILNREKKSMDFAQTFAKRNALKHLLGIQSVPGQTKNNPIDTWDVPVLCWRPTNGNIIKWDATQYKQLQERVGGMISGNNGEFEPHQIELNAGREHASSEEELLTKTVDPEDQIEEREDEPIFIGNSEDNETDEKTDNPGLIDPDYAKASINYNQVKEMFPEEFSIAVQDLKIDESADMSIETMKKVCDSVNSILDNAAAE